jgi:hypothetical protein
MELKPKVTHPVPNRASKLKIQISKFKDIVCLDHHLF